MFECLQAKCRQLSSTQFKFDVPLYSLDATVISLCYGLFPWAKSRTRKGAIKLHALLSNFECLPQAVVLTDGNVHELTVAKDLDLPPDSIRWTSTLTSLVTKTPTCPASHRLGQGGNRLAAIIAFFDKMEIRNSVIQMSLLGHVRTRIPIRNVVLGIPYI